MVADRFGGYDPRSLSTEASGGYGWFPVLHRSPSGRRGCADCRPSCPRSGTGRFVESPGGVSPPGAPRSVREPLDSYGSRCSAVSMAQLPMSEERRICAAKAIKPVACSFGFETQPFEFAARPADDIG